MNNNDFHNKVDIMTEVFSEITSMIERYENLIRSEHDPKSILCKSAISLIDDGVWRIHEESLDNCTCKEYKLALEKSVQYIENSIKHIDDAIKRM